jgi:unsaturated rhamnogalacturonyl hydrolase
MLAVFFRKTVNSKEAMSEKRKHQGVLQREMNLVSNRMRTVTRFCAVTGLIGIFGANTVFAAEPQTAEGSKTATLPISASYIYSRPAIMSLMRRACDYQFAEQAKTRHNNGWIRATFYTGVLATYRTTYKDPKYKDAAIKWGNDSHWALSVKDPRHADNQACIQVYSELYEMSKNPDWIAGARTAIDNQIATPKTGREQWWWCDALFMAPPAYARLSAVTGDPKYAAFMNNQYWDSKDFLFDKNEDLFFRDKGYFNKKTKNGKKIFWSRGNGWVFGGLCRILEYLPPSDPRYNDFVSLYKEMAKRLVGLQGEDGLWRSSLLDAAEFPMPETSGSAFYTFGLAWGVNHKLLDRDTYLPAAQKGWAGLTSQVNAEGRLGYVQKVAGSPGPSKPEDTQEYAVGALLLAGEQMADIAKSNARVTINRP